MVGVWVIASAILCLSGHALGQLGEGGVVTSDDGQQEAEGRDPPPDTSQQGGRREGADDVLREDKGARTVVLRVGRPLRWKALEDTYQGCYSEEGRFNGTLLFVELAQVMEEHKNVSSEEEACFHICHMKKPFSSYVVIKPSPSDEADACGCKNYLDPDKKVPDHQCNKTQHFRAYCGPSHVECFNAAWGVACPCLPMVLTALLTLLLSSPHSPTLSLS